MIHYETNVYKSVIREVKSMNQDAMIFALSNPDPEILPSDALNAGTRLVNILQQILYQVRLRQFNKYVCGLINSTRFHLIYLIEEFVKVNGSQSINS